VVLRLAAGTVALAAATEEDTVINYSTEATWERWGDPSSYVYRLRVPSGWLYRFDSPHTGPHMVFVPYANEPTIRQSTGPR
jgi:hypothetical protein